MHRPLLALVFAVLAAAAATAPNISDAEGVAFHDLTFKKALARAAAEEKPVLMYFTTTWCAPCRVMEATTFMDPDVAGWVARHTLAVKVDGDRKSGLAKRIGGGAFPTVAFVVSDGTVVDRLPGLLDSEAFLTFGKNVLAGNYGVELPSRRPRSAQRPPKVVRSATPDFPSIAMSHGLEGYVRMEFTITAAGLVRDATVIEAEPPGIFDRAALRAIRQYRFEPATADGEAVEVQGVTRRISFRQMRR